MSQLTEEGEKSYIIKGGRNYEALTQNLHRPLYAPE